MDPNASVCVASRLRGRRQLRQEFDEKRRSSLSSAVTATDSM
ncbi:hypothetical protein HD597_000463 [Nonomuraea thailandensis]|uniref:Uncharacterized protein n=1 Tax=Nonomuraea thailandensis TaxID=1188745 RepID=A0A9X2GG38_9ACTN|nr:hypothetical protein [Nonomuraea thailandensis]